MRWTATWGPDDRIYFRSCATWDPQGASNCGIWSAQKDGGGVHQLTDNPNHLPTDVNRERLLFMFNNGGNWDVYSASLKGGAPQNLTNHPDVDVWGTLSPDGRSTAFLSNRGGRWAIWLANGDGSNPREWLPINPDWGEVDPDRIGQERMSWSR
jgi:tricorn protease-like protein